jgi:P27 family predicted phage terminase small subunit
MANIKPIDLKVGHSSTKAEIEARKNTEESMKGNPISDKAPSRLTANGKKIYKHLVSSFPKGFLTETDTYSLEILCNAIDMLQIAQKDIRERGILIEGSENPSVKVYDKFFKVFNTMAGKLGMSPRDRSQLALLMVNQQQDKEDELLNILRS